MAARADTGVPVRIDRVRATVPLVEAVDPGVGDPRLAEGEVNEGSAEPRRPSGLDVATGFFALADMMMLRTVS